MFANLISKLGITLLLSVVWFHSATTFAGRIGPGDFSQMAEAKYTYGGIHDFNYAGGASSGHGRVEQQGSEISVDFNANVHITEQFEATAHHGQFGLAGFVRAQSTFNLNLKAGWDNGDMKFDVESDFSLTGSALAAANFDGSRAFGKIEFQGVDTATIDLNGKAQIPLLGQGLDFTTSLHWDYDALGVQNYNALYGINGELANFAIFGNSGTLNASFTKHLAYHGPGDLIEVKERLIVAFNLLVGFSSHDSRFRLDGRNTVTLSSITFADGSTPESHGYSILFASGRTSPNLVNAAPGDFDGDGDIDGADFLTWQRTDDTANTLSDWYANYGTTPNPLAAKTSVPEPTSLLLTVLACLGMQSARWTTAKRRPIKF